jgi:hypothetical protein
MVAIIFSPTVYSNPNKITVCTILFLPVTIVGRAITIWEAKQKRSHEPIYKTYTRIEAKRLRATTFAIAKLEGG